MFIPIAVLGVALLMIGVERARPGRAFPRVAGWLPRAVLFNGVQVGVVYAAGALWEPLLRSHRPWSADGLGLVGGSVVGYLAITFVYYWWHRWRHEVPFLWRWVHQLHHSPQRIEILTSFYKHPIELVANSLLSGAILYLGVGLGPEAASIVILITGLAELFYHWNVSTPRWLGYVFQRPESHCLHHESGVHSNNYSDLPLWDMLFGTFQDPGASWTRPCGFQDGGEFRVMDLLRGRNVAE
jgi:sterol desaturase/sphingolipid hydroxylase (fatty acid hydroxylase superfamily)